MNFSKIWNFSNCIGSIDGKHIAMQAPSYSESEYYSYKHFNSIILVGVCDANYKFTLIDLGAYGRQGGEMCIIRLEFLSCLMRENEVFHHAANFPTHKDIYHTYF